MFDEKEKITHQSSKIIKPRWSNGEQTKKDKVFETGLRPLFFEDFPGQTEIKNQLKIFIKAAQKRKESLDHTLLCGPPGLGKTTLALIIAKALNASVVSITGPALCRKGDLAAILTSLKPFSVFFIDEIHRLSHDVEEYLYSAMEDFSIDLVTGEGLGARTMQFQLSPFTLIGATTRSGLLKAPFRDRFGIIERLSFYSPKDLVEILKRSAEILKISTSQEGALEIAQRSRGTPRVSNRLLKRVRDYAQVKGDGIIDKDMAQFALNSLGIDALGLDASDQRILQVIEHKFGGGPVGVETLSAVLNEEVDTIEEVYEPYLIQEGLLEKTPRGRILTDFSKKYLSQKSN